MYLQTINKVKVTYQGQGHTSRSRSNQGQHEIEVIFKERYSYVGGLHLNQMRSCFLVFITFNRLNLSLSARKLPCIAFWGMNVYNTPCSNL